MLIVTLIASLLISVLSGLGVGGGGLFVIYLALFTDTPQLAAQGINLLFFLFSAGAAVMVHLWHRQIFGKAVLFMALFGIIGALAGSVISGFIDESILRKIFGGMLTVSGILSIKNSLSSNDRKKK